MWTEESCHFRLSPLVCLLRLGRQSRRSGFKLCSYLSFFFFFCGPHLKSSTMLVGSQLVHLLSCLLLVSILKELCYEIYQNSNSTNCLQIEWNTKNNFSKTCYDGIDNTVNKNDGTDGQTWRKLQRIVIVGFWKQFFKVSFCCL